MGSPHKQPHETKGRVKMGRTYKDVIDEITKEVEQHGPLAEFIASSVLKNICGAKKSSIVMIDDELASKMAIKNNPDIFEIPTFPLRNSSY